MRGGAGLVIGRGVFAAPVRLVAVIAAVALALPSAASAPGSAKPVAPGLPPPPLALPSAASAQGSTNPFAPGFPQPSVSIPSTTTVAPTISTTTTGPNASGL